MAKAPINSLPENILLDIFSYLPVKEVCLINRVCRNWRRIGRDNTLWKHVDLTPYKIDLRRMWKMLRSHFSKSLLTLRISGFLVPEGKQWHRSVISKAMLEDIRSRCPNIQELELSRTVLQSFNISDFPQNLRGLRITNSHYPLGWFKDLKGSCLGNALERVDLSLSRALPQDVVDVAEGCPNLRVLYLSGCYRFNDAAMKAIADNLNKLNELHLQDADITDLALHHLCRNVTELKVLDISNSKNIKHHGLDLISSCLHNLQTLILQDCKQLDLQHLKILSRLKHLKYLNAIGLTNKFFISQQQLDAWFPNATVLPDNLEEQDNDSTLPLDAGGLDA